jgi:hypothetical protein
MTFAELVQASSNSVPPLDRLTLGQEAHLVSDEKLLLIAVLALNQWSLTDMVSFYASPGNPSPSSPGRKPAGGASFPVPETKAASSRTAS